MAAAARCWHLLRRAGVAVARRTVQRLMRAEGLHGVVRGPSVLTTRPDRDAPAEPGRT